MHDVNLDAVLADEGEQWEWHFDSSFTQLNAEVIGMEVDKVLHPDSRREAFLFIQACLVMLPPQTWVKLKHVQFVADQWGFPDTLATPSELANQGKHFKHWQVRSGKRSTYVQLSPHFYAKPLLPLMM